MDRRPLEAVADTFCAADVCKGRVPEGMPAPLCQTHAQVVAVHILADTDLGQRMASALAEADDMAQREVAAAQADVQKHAEDLITERLVNSLGRGGGLVYFVRSVRDGYIKIGWSTNLPQRLRMFDQCVLMHAEPGTVKHERMLQDEFRDLNERPPNHQADRCGFTEWFRPDPRLHARIADLIKNKHSLMQTDGRPRSGRNQGDYLSLWSGPEIRLWAKAAGYTVAAKGSIPLAVRRAYEQAILAA